MVGIKWPGPDPMGERILINANTADTGGEWLAVWEGAQTWNDVDAADFYFDYGGRTTGTDFADDGVNQVFWTSSGLPPEALAVASCWYSAPTDYIFDCDMAFNDNYNWDTSGSPGPSEYDVQSIATHEFGHFLMLSDLYGAADSAKIMYGYASAGTIKRTLHPDDIAGIRWIYPGSGTRGQYIAQITNNDDDFYSCVDFKSDLDAVYDRCLQDVAAGTTSSFEVPVTAGSRTISIRWTDPDTGQPCEDSVGINVPTEGVATAPLEISSNCGVVHPPVVVRAGSGTVREGDQITVPVDALDVPAGSIGSFTVEVDYDPALLDAIDCTPDPDGILDFADCNPVYDNNNVFPDLVRCTGVSITAVSGPELTLCDITFRANDPQPVPLPVLTPLSVDCPVLTDPAGQPIECISEYGEIEINGGLVGDVTCDDLVNVVDALFILQYEVGLRADSGGCPLPLDTLHVAACDVNHDQACNVVDALFILQCEVGASPGAEMDFCLAAQAAPQETSPRGSITRR